MSIAQTRLDAYLAAEARILSAGFSHRFAERQHQEAELSAIQSAIRRLQAQVAAESGLPPSRGSLRYRSTVFG